MSKHVVTVVEDDNGNLVLPLTDQIMDQVGWTEGDTLEWKDNGDGSFGLTKKETTIEETDWVLVECVSQFRQRYVVEVPKGKTDWATDSVVMNEAKEFSQEHLGETVVSHRVISKEEFLKMCNKDNDYCLSWNDEKKIDSFLTRWDFKLDKVKGSEA